MPGQTALSPSSQAIRCTILAVAGAEQADRRSAVGQAPDGLGQDVDILADIDAPGEQDNHAIRRDAEFAVQPVAVAPCRREQVGVDAAPQIGGVLLAQQSRGAGEILGLGNQDVGAFALVAAQFSGNPGLDPAIQVDRIAEQQAGKRLAGHPPDDPGAEHAAAAGQIGVDGVDQRDRPAFPPPARPIARRRSRSWWCGSRRNRPMPFPGCGCATQDRYGRERCRPGSRSARCPGPAGGSDNARLGARSRTPASLPRKWTVMSTFVRVRHGGTGQLLPALDMAAGIRRPVEIDQHGDAQRPARHRMAGRPFVDRGLVGPIHDSVFAWAPPWGSRSAALPRPTMPEAPARPPGFPAPA